MKLVFPTTILSGAFLTVMVGCKPMDSSKLDQWVETVRDKVGAKNEKERDREGSAKGDSKDHASFTSRYEASQARAVSEFPELAIAGSAFNAEFLARVKALKSEDIRYFNNPEWPYDLAKRVGEIMRTRTGDPNSVSSVLVAQRPSLYVDQWVSVSGTATKVNGLSINTPVVVEFEGGVKAEITAEQFVRRRIGGITDWSEQGYRMDIRNGTLIFLMRNDTGRMVSWTELFALMPGTTLTVKGQVTRSGERLVMKNAKLMAWSEMR
jgi:hypothetical protein